MRIFIINANWGRGGPGGVASDLYYVLEKEGNKCCFAYARGTVPKDVNSYRIGTMADVYLHAASSRLFDNAGFMSAHATNKLIKEIQRYKPDVISMHNLLGYTLHVEKLFSYIRESRIPTFWTLHDCWAVTGHCITGLCDHWKNGCGHCPRKHDFPKSLLLDRSAQNVKRKNKCFSGIDNLHLITPSKWLANILKDTFLGEYPITIIPNGIDLKVFKPTENNLREKYELIGKTILLTVAGIWVDTKGGNYFAQLVDRLDESFVFVMIGKNSDQYLKESKRTIHFERTKDRQQLVQWYTTADIFINPTMGDNFPTVNLEALACGTPVVTFNTGGSAESVGDCGEIAAQGDINALVKAILDCRDRKISSDVCINRARSYDKNERYRDYLDIYQLEIGSI